MKIITITSEQLSSKIIQSKPSTIWLALGQQPDNLLPTAIKFIVTNLPKDLIFVTGNIAKKVEDDIDWSLIDLDIFCATAASEAINEDDICMLYSSNIADEEDTGVLIALADTLQEENEILRSIAFEINLVFPTIEIC